MNSVWMYRIGIGIVLLGLTYVLGGFIYSLLPSIGGFGEIGSPLGIILLGIAALIAFSIWRGAASQAGATVINLGSIVSEQPIRGILIGAVLLVVAYLLYEYFWSLSDALVAYSGTSVRVAWLVLGLLALMILPAIFIYFSPTGLPVESATVKKAAKSLMMVWVLFFGWLFYERPNDLYGHADGSVKCWVAEDDPEIYSSSGFSSLTGAKLRQCTKKEALAAANGSWTKDASKYAKKIKDELKSFLSELNKPAPNGSNAGPVMDEWKKPAKQSAAQTLCDGCVFMRPGEIGRYEFGPRGVKFLSGQVRVRCLDKPCPWLGKTAWVHHINVEQYRSAVHKRPCFYDNHTFPMEFEAVSDFSFRKLTESESCLKN